MKRLSQLVIAGMALAIAGVASTASVSLDSLVPALRQGGYVIVLRHGATDSSQSDVYPLDYTDPSKQRQLSAQGRDTARQLGTSFQTLGIPLGEVLTSRLTRAVETGRLVTGKEVGTLGDLSDSSMGSTAAMAGSPGQANASAGAALRALVATKPAPKTNTLIVTHKTNIQDAFGKPWSDLGEGDALIFKPDATDASTPLLRARPEDWMALANSTRK